VSKMSIECILTNLHLVDVKDVYNLVGEKDITMLVGGNVK